MANTPPPAGGKPPAKAKAAATPHSVFVELVFEIIGVSVLAIVADSNAKLGKAVVALMAGFAFVWLLLHYQFFAGLIGKGASGT